MKIEEMNRRGFLRNASAALGVFGVFGTAARRVLSAEPECTAAACGEGTCCTVEKGKWRSLFNGRDLTGWIGATEGYVVEDGVLVCTRRGKKIYTEEEFSDFRIYFEFLLSPNANNGLGIRSPFEVDSKPANPAYDGMEIQIMDDYGDKNQKWKPHQLHGSIYGVLAPKTGHLKPVGEWNRQEVIAKGRNVQVILNGVKILDADLDQLAASPAPSGREHPGLKRDRGHISFLGHGSEVRFRDIRILDLSE